MAKLKTKCPRCGRYLRYDVRRVRGAWVATAHCGDLRHWKSMRCGDPATAVNNATWEANCGKA